MIDTHLAIFTPLLSRSHPLHLGLAASIIWLLSGTSIDDQERQFDPCPLTCPFNGRGSLSMASTSQEEQIEEVSMKRHSRFCLADSTWKIHLWISSVRCATSSVLVSVHPSSAILICSLVTISSRSIQSSPTRVVGCRGGSRYVEG